MKSNRKSILALLIWALLSFGVLNSFSQNFFNLKAGVGIPETPSFSLGFQLEQVQLMAGIGNLPIPDDNLFSIFGDLYIHMWGNSVHSGIKPWYGRVGINNFQEKTARWIDRYNYLDLRLGRSMFLNEHLAIELDLGLAIELSYEREYITPATSWLNIEFPLLPAIGSRLVYHFAVTPK